ncbi:MAG: hypothetical protein Q7S17_09385 [Xanthobacteraceae bacterium]|nr:hypothetical protein [Xanthobacteraceae bacterium]
MARVFDCFPFFNELDILEIRLHELSPVVDKFVLAEATTTFSGAPKPLYFLKNRDRFAEFADRIVHVVVDDMPGDVRSGWVRQTHQRNALLRGLSDARPEDLILLSDVDEITRGSAIAAAAARPADALEILCFELRMYNYFVNFEMDKMWLRSGPRAVRRRLLRNFSSLRTVRGPSKEPLRNLLRGIRTWRAMGRPLRRVVVRDAGWHFTYLGGADAVRTKLLTFIDSEKVSDEMLDSQHLAACISAGLPMNRRRDTSLTYRPLDQSFPHYLLENRERFAHLILQATAINDHIKFSYFRQGVLSRPLMKRSPTNPAAPSA